MPDNDNARPGPESETGGKRVDQDRVRSLADWRASERCRARRQLDQVLGIPDSPMGEIDYSACGLDLGWPERVAAGVALLERSAA